MMTRSAGSSPLPSLSTTLLTAPEDPATNCETTLFMRKPTPWASWRERIMAPMVGPSTRSKGSVSMPTTVTLVHCEGVVGG